MNKDFDNIGSLIDEVVKDKQATGANASVLNRYPVRFVLFDSFADSKEFVDKLMELGGVSKMQKIASWISPEQPDQMLTYSCLADKICQYIYDNEKSDCVIVPFSELARFYDNDEAKEFDTLVSKIKGIETTRKAFESTQRVYVPMIGQLGKMAKFFDDTQCTIWHCKSSSSTDTYYQLVLSKSTYGVSGLEQEYSIVPTLTSWLEMWRNEDAKDKIICTSPSINALAHFAQPDNAFTYTICKNAYEFLTNGLHLDFGDIIYRHEDASNWEILARSIEYKNFSFDKFFNKHFDIYALDDAEVFVKTWFDHTDHFERWLLTTYYVKRFCGRGYICRALREMTSYSNQDFVTAAALTIFTIEDNPMEPLDERAVVMKAAEKHRIHITEDAENKLGEKLEELALTKGYDVAMRYMTELTDTEKCLMIKWIGDGRIAVNKIENVFPTLCHYLDKSLGVSTAGKKWMLDYMDAYKMAKVGNRYTQEVKETVEKKNENAASFYTWYNMFKTVETELSGRNDIEVFYWIDGLGIDWIPYIKWLLEKYESENVHLNDIIVARSSLPTTTEKNKVGLLKMAGDSLSKKGDLDSFAHKCTPYPQYIVEEMRIVEQAISDIVHEHAGKKVAIVSDHGLSYLSQLLGGYNLGGIKQDHFGRLATIQTGGTTQDGKYVVLDDNTTMCALRHESLSAKIPNGQGCHGGCTPEEALVPIFIISSQPKSSEYTVNLLDNEVSGANPVLTFRIKGVTALDIPRLIYNKVGYNLNDNGGERFVSDRIDLEQGVNEVEVRIGTYAQTFKLKINLGAEEDDLFDL